MDYDELNRRAGEVWSQWVEFESLKKSLMGKCADTRLIELLDQAGPSEAINRSMRDLLADDERLERLNALAASQPIERRDA